MMSMEKIARGLVACALVAPLMLVGCGGDNKAEEPAKQEQSQQTESKKESAGDVFVGGENTEGTTGSKTSSGKDADAPSSSSSSAADASSSQSSSSSSAGDGASSERTPASSVAARANATGDENAKRDESTVADVAKGAITASEADASESTAQPAEMKPSLVSVAAFTDSAAKPQGASEEGWWRTVSVSGVVKNVSDTTDLDARCLPEMSVCGTKLVASIDGSVIKPGESGIYSYFGTVRIPEGVQVTWGAGNGECNQDGIDADDSSGEPHSMEQIGADGASQLVAKLVAQTKFGNRKLSHN